MKTIAEAQKVVEEVVEFYNTQREHEETGEVPLRRFKEAIKEGKGRIRPLDPSVDIDLVFSLHYERRVKKDGSFSFQGKDYRLGRFGGELVTVCLIPKKKLMVVKDKQKVGEFHL